MKRLITVWLPVGAGVLAAGLAALAARTWLTERDFARDHPPPGRLVDADGAKLHVIERGTGSPPLLLIHGNPGSSLDFADTVMNELAKRHRVVAVDRPGHAWSERPTLPMTPLDQARSIHAAARTLGLERPVVVGFSYGGPVSLAYVTEFPADVRALVLLAALASPDDPHIGHPVQNALTWPVVGPLMAWTIGPLAAPGEIAKGLVAGFSPNPVDAAMLPKATLLWSRPGDLLATANDWPSLDASFRPLAARYPEIRVPVEALPGGGDRIVGPGHE